MTARTLLFYRAMLAAVILSLTSVAAIAMLPEPDAYPVAVKGDMLVKRIMPRPATYQRTQRSCWVEARGLGACPDREI